MVRLATSARKARRQQSVNYGQFCMKVVNKDKTTFICNFCGNAFTRKDNCIRHLKLSHHRPLPPSVKMSAEDISLAMPVARVVLKRLSLANQQSFYLVKEEGKLKVLPVKQDGKKQMPERKKFCEERPKSTKEEDGATSARLPRTKESTQTTTMKLKTDPIMIAMSRKKEASLLGKGGKSVTKVSMDTSLQKTGINEESSKSKTDDDIYLVWEGRKSEVVSLTGDSSETTSKRTDSNEAMCKSSIEKDVYSIHEGEGLGMLPVTQDKCATFPDREEGKGVKCKTKAQKEMYIVIDGDEVEEGSLTTDSRETLPERLKNREETTMCSIKKDVCLVNNTEQSGVPSPSKDHNASSPGMSRKERSFRHGLVQPNGLSEAFNRRDDYTSNVENYISLKKSGEGKIEEKEEKEGKEEEEGPEIQIMHNDRKDIPPQRIEQREEVNKLNSQTGKSKTQKSACLLKGGDQQSRKRFLQRSKNAEKATSCSQLKSPHIKHQIKEQKRKFDMENQSSSKGKPAKRQKIGDDVDITSGTFSKDDKHKFHCMMSVRPKEMRKNERHNGKNGTKSYSQVDTYRDHGKHKRCKDQHVSQDNLNKLWLRKLIAEGIKEVRPSLKTLGNRDKAIRSLKIAKKLAASKDEGQRDKSATSSKDNTGHHQSARQVRKEKIKEDTSNANFQEALSAFSQKLKPMTDFEEKYELRTERSSTNSLNTEIGGETLNGTENCTFRVEKMKKHCEEIYSSQRTLHSTVPYTCRHGGKEQNTGSDGELESSSQNLHRSKSNTNDARESEKRGKFHDEKLQIDRKGACEVDIERAEINRAKESGNSGMQGTSVKEPRPKKQFDKGYKQRMEVSGTITPHFGGNDVPLKSKEISEPKRRKSEEHCSKHQNLKSRHRKKGDHSSSKPSTQDIHKPKEKSSSKSDSHVTTKRKHRELERNFNEDVRKGSLDKCKPTSERPDRIRSDANLHEKAQDHRSVIQSSEESTSIEKVNVNKTQVKSISQEGSLINKSQEQSMMDSSGKRTSDIESKPNSHGRSKKSERNHRSVRELINERLSGTQCQGKGEGLEESLSKDKGKTESEKPSTMQSMDNKKRTLQSASICKDYSEKVSTQLPESVSKILDKEASDLEPQMNQQTLHRNLNSAGNLNQKLHVSNDSVSKSLHESTSDKENRAKKVQEKSLSAEKGTTVESSTESSDINVPARISQDKKNKYQEKSKSNNSQKVSSEEQKSVTQQSKKIVSNTAKSDTKSKKDNNIPEGISQDKKKMYHGKSMSNNSQKVSSEEQKLVTQQSKKTVSDTAKSDGKSTKDSSIPERLSQDKKKKHQGKSKSNNSQNVSSEKQQSGTQQSKKTVSDTSKSDTQSKRDNSIPERISQDKKKHQGKSKSNNSQKVFSDKQKSMTQQSKKTVPNTELRDEKQRLLESTESDTKSKKEPNKQQASVTEIIKSTSDSKFKQDERLHQESLFRKDRLSKDAQKDAVMESKDGSDADNSSHVLQEKMKSNKKSKKTFQLNHKSVTESFTHDLSTEYSKGKQTLPRAAIPYGGSKDGHPNKTRSIADSVHKSLSDETDQDERKSAVGSKSGKKEDTESVRDSPDTGASSTVHIIRKRKEHEPKGPVYTENSEKPTNEINVSVVETFDLSTSSTISHKEQQKLPAEADSNDNLRKSSNENRATVMQTSAKSASAISFQKEKHTLVEGSGCNKGSALSKEIHASVEDTSAQRTLDLHNQQGKYQLPAESDSTQNSRKIHHENHSSEVQTSDKSNLNITSLEKKRKLPKESVVFSQKPSKESHEVLSDLSGRFESRRKKHNLSDDSQTAKHSKKRCHENNTSLADPMGKNTSDVRWQKKRKLEEESETNGNLNKVSHEYHMSVTESSSKSASDAVSQEKRGSQEESTYTRATVIEGSTKQIEEAQETASSDLVSDRIQTSVGEEALTVPKGSTVEPTISLGEYHLTLDGISTERILASMIERRCVFVCRCGILFKDQILYLIHRSTHSDDDRYGCSYCDYIARDWCDFLGHFDDHNPKGL